MLVLSRKAGEKIVIGDSVTVVVQRVAGNRVSLAIRAPKDVRILRGELNRDSEPDDNRSSTSTSPAEDLVIEEAPAV